MVKDTSNGSYKFHPLTSDRWKDLEKLFGERGACGGCWCMAWRLKRADFKNQTGTGNKKAFKKLVKSNEPLGVLAYKGDDAIGWCSVSPRETFLRLENSKVLRRIDEQPVWSVSCLFIDKKFRRQGLSVKLLEAAIQFCKSNGAKIIEGYPTVPYSENIPAAFAWTGIPSSFIKAGFKEAARRSKPRPIMRYYIK